MTIPQKLSGLYLSHGGGPMPLMGDADHQEMVDTLRNIARHTERPSAIVMVSAHWESDAISITSNAAPDLLFDYFGFPDAAYQYQYPAPGHPALAKRIQNALNETGIESALDPERGFDHGMFVPLILMYPEADIPCVQVSLSKSLDPALHIQIGKALGTLLEEDALLIGSGFSFHNMRAFRDETSETTKQQNEAFEAWLIETCSNEDLSEDTRVQRLLEWEQAPAARFCHPREEHLLPLHVCYGAFERASSHTIELSIIKKKASMYLW